jgi:hypothetical protein
VVSILTTLSFFKREKRTKFWLGSLKRRDHSEDLGVDGRIILKWIFGRNDGYV